MDQENKRMHPCPHCAALLPESASFCPYCVRSINRRNEIVTPAIGWRKALHRTLLILLPLLLVGGVGVWQHTARPQTYEAPGEICYTGSGSTYHLFLCQSGSSQEPVREICQTAIVGEAYRSPVLLRINDADTGTDAGASFLEQVSRVTAEFPTTEGGGGNFSCTAPAPHSAFPGVPLICLVDYTISTEAGSAAQMAWTITMKNGDTIRLTLEYIVSAAPVYDYYPADAPMETTEELQALIDQASAAVDPLAVINIHLPAETYSGTLVIRDRAVNLYGSVGTALRTVFTGSIRTEAREDSRIIYLQDIDFYGSGSGTGVSAATNTRATDCTFAGWETGFYGGGSAWINAIGCTFSDNRIGLCFDSPDGGANHTMYNDNIFRDNGTAVLLEEVPSDVPLNFQGSVFEGNRTDIDNRSGQQLELSEAIFR